MGNKKRGWYLLLGSVFLLSLSIAVLSLCLGTICFSPGELVKLLWGKGNSAAGSADVMSRGILLYARLPRTFASLLAGGALAVSGAVLQNVLANKLAAPGIIGINAGAGLGVTVCCGLGILSGFAVSFAAFAGSLITVILIVCSCLLESIPDEQLTSIQESCL